MSETEEDLDTQARKKALKLIEDAIAKGKKRGIVSERTAVRGAK
jgi:hypothetical protein